MIIEKEGLNVSSFSRKIGVGDQTIRGIVVLHRNKPGYDVILKIAQTFAWLNLEWLIIGVGDMEKTPQYMQVETSDDEEKSLKILVDYLREKDRTIERLIEERTIWQMKCQGLIREQNKSIINKGVKSQEYMNK